MNLQKQQLKHEHRDRMVQIGITAIEHTLRYLPEDESARRIISERLDKIRSHDLAELVKQVRRDVKKSQSQNQVQRLMDATNELVLLVVSEKYISGEMLEFVLVPAWNSLFMSDREMMNEMAWQKRILHPRIEDSFRELRIAEKKLGASHSLEFYSPYTARPCIGITETKTTSCTNDVAPTSKA